MITKEERDFAADCIRRIVSQMGKHPWDINCGECDEFSDKLLEALGPEAESFWVTNLPDYPYDRDDHDISHVVTLWKGLYFDSEEPYGVSDWRYLPCCARAIRKLDGCLTLNG